MNWVLVIALGLSQGGGMVSIDGFSSKVEGEKAAEEVKGELANSWRKFDFKCIKVK
jgi:hypothetical protein